MKETYEVNYSYKEKPDGIPIELKQNFEFPFPFVDNESAYLNFIAEKHDVPEEWVSIIKVKPLT